MNNNEKESNRQKLEFRLEWVKNAIIESLDAEKSSCYRKERQQKLMLRYGFLKKSTKIQEKIRRRHFTAMTVEAQSADRIALLKNELKSVQQKLDSNEFC